MQKLTFMDNELNQIKLTHDIQIITKKYSQDGKLYTKKMTFRSTNQRDSTNFFFKDTCLSGL